MRALELLPLTAVGFAPFGDVIDTAVACERYPINEGRTQRHHALSKLDCEGQDGCTALSVFRATPVDNNFLLQGLERHPLSSQSFIPLSPYPYAVVVAPAGSLQEDAISGFLAQPGQSITYRKGTWHHYLLALRAPSDFVVVDRVGPGENCDEQVLVEPLSLIL
ncbi:MAG: ureidoglycolate lyase [Pseudomonadota bacterium]